MELTLNIYDGKKVKKTYTATDFKLLTGDVEDILNLISVDSFKKGINDEEATTEIIKAVTKGFSKFKPIVQNIFDGLTDEEYRHTSIQELGGVIFQVFTFAISEMFAFSSVKN